MKTPSMYNETTNQRIDHFIKELTMLCVKYHLSIAHEDNQGAFIIQSYKHENIIWLKSAIREVGE